MHENVKEIRKMTNLKRKEKAQMFHHASRYLLLAKEVTDLNRTVGVGDGGVDWEVSVDESHLVAVTLGNASDEVLNVAEGSANGGGSLAGAEPSVNLELPLSDGLIGDELEVEVEMLEVASKLPAGSFHLDLHLTKGLHST